MKDILHSGLPIAHHMAGKLIVCIEMNVQQSSYVYQDFRVFEYTQFCTRYDEAPRISSILELLSDNLQRARFFE